MYKGCCCCWSGRSYCFKSHFYSLRKLLTVASYRLIRKGREKLHRKLKKGRSQNYSFCKSIMLPVVKLGQFSAGLLIQAISLRFQLFQLLLSQFCKRLPWWNWRLNFLLLIQRFSTEYRKYLRSPENISNLSGNNIASGPSPPSFSLLRQS